MGYFDRGLFWFLTDLSQNNDRQWFTENRERYERDVKDACIGFISDAGPKLKTISPYLVADPKPVGGSLFRIHRDVRFSKDKSPYKTHAGMHFPLGVKGVHGPGYYLHIEPGTCFVAGGMWQPEPDALRAIRERIVEEKAEWKKAAKLLDDDGNPLKRPPQGFDPEHPMIEDIKRRSFTGSVRLSQKQILAPDLMATFIASCKKLTPLMRFLASSVGAPWK